MAALCPLCGCAGSCNAIITIKVLGCPIDATGLALGSSPLPGATVAWNQVATSTSGSATTDALGFASFTYQNTGSVDFSVSATRYTTQGFSITPVCNHTTTSTRLLVAASGYKCLPGGCGYFCKYPVATTLYFTSPATGATLTMTFASGAWDVFELLTLTPVCDTSGGHAVNMHWIFTGCLDGSHSVCTGGDNVTAISTTGVGPIATYSRSDMVAVTSAVTCPVPGAFTANGTFANMYFSGSWALTE